MDHDQGYVYVLTRLTINSDGQVISENVAATFDIFEAESYRASALEHDFEKYPLSSDWRESAEQSNVVAVMREFRQIVEDMQRAALR